MASAIHYLRRFLWTSGIKTRVELNDAVATWIANPPGEPFKRKKGVARWWYDDFFRTFSINFRKFPSQVLLGLVRQTASREPSCSRVASSCWDCFGDDRLTIIIVARVSRSTNVRKTNETHMNNHFSQLHFNINPINHGFNANAHSHARFYDYFGFNLIQFHDWYIKPDCRSRNTSWAHNSRRIIWYARK